MTHAILDTLGLASHDRVVEPASTADTITSVNPATGEPIAGVKLDSKADLERVLAESVEAFDRWRWVPAPQRGEVVRAIGDELRKYRDPLGELVSLEMGKIRAEGIGEIQEIVDIADFAVGLSRQLHGITMPSERSNHMMKEQWLPLGPIGVITAFNFPAAVWGWNGMLAAVAGDVTIWKPSLLTPLTAIACNSIAERVASAMGHKGVFQLVIGNDEEVSVPLTNDRRVPLISATGSCRMGREVGKAVAARLGKCLLELGGNNAVIIEPDADLDLATKNVFFGAVGTCGQRCTSTRRLIVHESVAEDVVGRLEKAYRSLLGGGKIGDPLAEGTLVGPLIGVPSVEAHEAAVKTAVEQGGTLVVGGSRLDPSKLASNGLKGGFYVEPAMVRMPAGKHLPIALEETFSPILYVTTYSTLDEAIALQNEVDQGLSSALFCGSVRSMGRFLDPGGTGSDCGLAYVNCGTSGAEIGGAFGGEKDTGGGRESGSDAWKAYMRRQTCTIHFGESFALAQGIRFE
ncbi:MAG: aldehyde dehydrogenase family protein [Phycisphaerae bacterium]|nr:aldehyde dehydrogenase family protein [Phycisphaerae bacterium]